MAITSIDYPQSEIEATQSNTEQSQTEVAVVVFDTTPVSGLDAISQAGFYSGMPHRIMSWLAIEDGSLQAETIHGGDEWAISATYSIKGATASKSDTDLTSYRTEVVPFSWSYQRVVSIDKETGDAIENSAGDPFDPPFMEVVPNIGWRITMRETSANMSRCFSVGSINNASFQMLGLTIPKYCAQLSNFTPVPQYDEFGNFFSLNTYEVKWNFNESKEKANLKIGFKQEVLNAGYNALKTANDLTTIARRYLNNEPCVTQQKLKDDGTPELTKDTADYLQFVVNDLADFSTFGLPLNYPSFQG
tara:strand:+ start:13795 stop:14706 length:912 start_codon:yes stop_codon:yes gene_type:complete